MYKIGVFAKMNKVTVKTLRHYEEIGLLKPCFVDQSSGHRYYSTDQMNHLHRILVLKDIGFSLHEIMAATRRGISKNELVAYLRGKQSELSASIAMEQKKLRRLEFHINILLTEVDLMKKEAVVKEILPCIYLIEIPLPGNPLKALNSYLIKGPDRSLLVDTGFNSPICKDALLAGLRKADIDLNDLDFFITHMHGNHSGLVYDLANENSKIYCSEIDAELLNDTSSESHIEKVVSYFTMHGFLQIKVSESQNVMDQYHSYAGLKFSFVSEGEVLSVGGHNFTCIMTPGHSPGHVCLYEAQQKILIAGDHILADVSPNTSGWIDLEDSLGQYLESLEKVKRLDVDLILPGHRNFIGDSKKRIEELKQHHQKQLEDVLIILQNEPMTAYQVAHSINWHNAYASWNNFPQLQKWCAGEVISHLVHLVKQNKIHANNRDGQIIFQRNT